MQAFRIIINAAKSFYEELLFFFLTGIVVVICVIPAVLTFPTWFMIPALIPVPFALVGIAIIAHRSVRGLAVSWRLIWEAVKEFGPRALLLGAIILGGYVIFLANIWFYNSFDISPIPSQVTRWLTPLWLIMVLIWTGVTFYAGAFLIELEEPKMLMILRNSLSLTVLSPLTTLILLVIVAALTVLSVMLPVLFVVLPGFAATLSINAVRTLITAIREKYPTPAEDEASDDEATDEKAEA